MKMLAPNCAIVELREVRKRSRRRGDSASAPDVPLYRIVHARGLVGRREWTMDELKEQFKLKEEPSEDSHQ